MTHTPNPDPTDAVIDRMVDAHLTAAGNELTPSSGFAALVMESIQAQATEPPPIAFPWGRVLPGAIAAIFGLMALVVFAIRAAKESIVAAPSNSATLAHVEQALSFTHGQAMEVWFLLAACLTVVAIIVSFRLTHRSE